MTPPPLSRGGPDGDVPSIPGPASRALARRLRRVESRNVTYLGEHFPVFWRAASGAHVVDVDGNRFLDLTAAFGVALVGHAHPEVVEAVERQARTLLHGMGDVHPPEVKLELLERLAEVSPWEECRSVLTTSGSEAVEVALKTALLATGRPGIVAFEGGYHGLTLGSLAATAREDFRAPFRERLYAGVTFLPWPNDPTEATEVLERMRGSLGEVGAVLVEPIQARAGIRIPPPGFLAALGEVARAEGALLILDEIFTGFGRAGALFSGPAQGAIPDVICAGKALAGGLPVGVCMAPPAVMDAWPESEGEAIHTSTFLGHPLTCAAGVAVLKVVEEEEIPRKARDVGELLKSGLREELAGHPTVKDIRGEGLMVGVELDAVGPGAFAWTEEALALGLMLLPSGPTGHVISLTPPACLSEDEVALAVELLGRVAAIPRLRG